MKITRPHTCCAVVAALICLTAGACAPSPRELGRQAFFRQDYPAAQRHFEQMADEYDRNFVLYNLELGSAAFEAGNYHTARIAFERAVDAILGDESNIEGIASLVAHESAKLFKGDPFERVMANFYDGLIYYRWGDYYNARAAFSQALIADKSSKEGCRDDFAIAQYMIARCYMKIRQQDNTRIHLDMAREKYPDNPFFDIDLMAEHNLILVFQLGKAPVKIATGLAGSVSDYEYAIYSESSAGVYADDERLGSSSLAVDLVDQATAFEFGTSDIAQTAKGAVKTGLLVAAAADDDPSPFLVLAAKLEPGVYTFTIDFFDRGMVIPELRQTWQHVPVFADRDTLLVFRSGARAAQDSRAYTGDVKYCNDYTGHKPGTKPFIFGGTCTCTPTPELMEAYHRDGFLLEHTVSTLRQYYRDLGIVTAADHRDCNNLCEYGPHILEGGKCMVPPTPATPQYQRLITGAFTPPEQPEISEETSN